MEIRFFLQRDLPEVLDIEKRSYGHSWTEREFRAFLKDERSVGKVVVDGGRVIGYLMYLLRPKSIDIYNIAVHPEERRRGVARLLMTNLFTKFNQKRTRINAIAAEKNLASQLFFKAMGLKAIKIIHNAWENSNETGYLFEIKEDQLEEKNENLLERNAG